MNYSADLEILLNPLCEDDEADEAADRLVRYGMFLDRESVTPLVEQALNSPSECARVQVVSNLADYDVPLTPRMIASMVSYMGKSDPWEKVGIMFALLRDAKTYDKAKDRIESWVRNGHVLGADVDLVWGCLEDLKKVLG